MCYGKSKTTYAEWNKYTKILLVKDRGRTLVVWKNIKAWGQSDCERGDRKEMLNGGAILDCYEAQGGCHQKRVQLTSAVRQTPVTLEKVLLSIPAMICHLLGEATEILTFVRTWKLVQNTAAGLLLDYVKAKEYQGWLGDHLGFTVFLPAP